MWPGYEANLLSFTTMYGCLFCATSFRRENIRRLREDKGLGNLNIIVSVYDYVTYAYESTNVSLSRSCK